MTIELNNAERGMLVDLLVALSEVQGNAGCNDLSVVNNADARELWVAAQKSGGLRGDEITRPSEAASKFYADDFMYTHYFIDKFKAAQ